MKKVLILALISIVLLSGCSTVNSVVDNVVDQSVNIVQSTDRYVVTIQNATMKDTSYTYKDVFHNFFAYPTWKHFTSDTGQEVVEFTGECTYDNQTVKALIQFVITNESGDYMQWQTTYLSFNNVSQSLVMLTALLEKAVEEYDKKTVKEIGTQNNSTDLSENQLIKMAKKHLSVPDSGNITYELGTKMYNEAWEAYYVNVKFYEDNRFVAGANLDIKTGELLSNIYVYAPKNNDEETLQDENLLSVNEAIKIVREEASKKLNGSEHTQIDEPLKERESKDNYLISVGIGDGYSGAAHYYKVNKKTGAATFMGANQVGWELLDGCEEFK